MDAALHACRLQSCIYYTDNVNDQRVYFLFGHCDLVNQSMLSNINAQFLP